MAKITGKITNFLAGISDSPKLGPPASFAFASGFNFRSDPAQLTVNPKSQQIANGVISDLVMWWDLACSSLYGYGNTGTIYLKDSNDNWSVDTLLPNSSGNGLVFFPEDNYLYAAQNTTIARKSDACDTTGTWYAGFLESEGGEPTNGQSIGFVRASSQYASIADNTSLSITNDIALEPYIKLTTLPAANEVYTLISKWNENGNQRSYKLDITTSSNSFGDGRDSVLTINANTTEDPIDANCTGTVGTYTLTLTNAHASFSSVASGDKLLIVQSRGSGVGTRQYATVSSYSAGVLTIQEPLTFSPTHSATASVAEKAQIRVYKQYTDVTVAAGKTYSAKLWDGFKGGILGFYANGTVTNNLGSFITSTGKGYNQNGLYNSASSDPGFGGQGEGTAGIGIGLPAVHAGNTAARLANGNGGGAGVDLQNTSAGGGGYANAGSNGNNAGAGTASLAIGGSQVGDANLVAFHFGGQGGGTGMGGGFTPGTYHGSFGGPGGGINDLWCAALNNLGTISSDGIGGIQGNAPDCPGAGGGSAGSNFIHCPSPVLGTITANKGSGSVGTSPKNRNGGDGSDGRNVVSYATSYIGTPTPAATFLLDSTLAALSGYILRFIISSNGTNTEIYTQDITSLLQTGVWNRWGISWQASTSTASFYQNATLLSTQMGALTAIFNSTARFAIATAYDSSGNPKDFLNGRMDDARVWNATRNQTQLSYYNDKVLVGTENNLSAYYKFEGNVNDSQTYTTTSNLTATNTPTYSTDVPFAGITTRADQDVLINASGSTYTLGTVVNEGATHRQTFQPTKEPLKSVMLNVNTVGTGNWTIVIHDALNRVLSTMTVTNANMHTSFYEFVLPSSVRPILTANYHIHVYSTVGDGKIVTSSLDDMEGSATPDTGAYLATFYQILVSDIYHPMKQFLNFIAIGNERYVAKLEAGNIYNPHQLILPAGYRVRSLATVGEYLAIGVWRGTSITDTDQGKIFLWDGTSDISGQSAPNTAVDCLQGGVNAMHGAGGILHVIAGYQGKYMKYALGGQLEKVTQMPKLSNDEYVEVAPGAMCMWRSLMHFGSCLNTDSSTVHQGVFSYGTLNSNYPISLGFDYPLSLGDLPSTGIKIGSLFPQGENLYIGWQKDNAYGVDVVDVTADPYANASMELLITDLGKIYQDKNAYAFRTEFSPLLSGQSVTVKFKPDRAADWIPLVTQSTIGAHNALGSISNRQREIQLAFDVVTNGQLLTIYGCTFEGEDGSEALGIA